ncbi:MAG: SMC-Scp complex subunit ScpB [Caldicoprobacterales bacterium]|nr:SMC-Scp complex subunit ScpB [Clostridiales bacterium]
MDEREIMGLIESLLFVSGDAIPAKRIAEFLNMDVRKVRKLMERLIDVFNFERRGLQVIRVDDSYQLATRPEYGEYIDKFFGSDKKQTLSQAVLETLSIIAYRQPITRMDIELIRGVKCEYAINVLIDKGLIKEVGRLDAPGRPILYGTTNLFLRSFGLSSLEDLPPLQE